MKKLIFLFALFPFLVNPQVNLIQNPYGRNFTTLNGKWKYVVDPYKSGKRNDWYEGIFMNRKQSNKSERIEYDFDKSLTIYVPGDWNTQSEKLFYYEGLIWYRKIFDYKKVNPSNRVFIYIGAANYDAEVFLNGNVVGSHKGGFTPFNFEITNYLKESDNSLFISVDNERKKEYIPALKTDWWNYGGITRDILLIEVPETFIIDYYIQLRKDSNNKIEGYVKLNGKDKTQEITVEIPELKISKKFQTDNNGYAKINFDVKKIELWSPENPKLYEVIIKSKNDIVKDEIGFRTIEVKGTDIYLNNKPIFLKGINIHEENPIRGNRAYLREDAKMLLGWAKELGCNFVRLAHYPHNEFMTRVADKMGILVWSEIPVYWDIDWSNPSTLEIAKGYLEEMISRDKNRASIIIWSVGNETPNNPLRHQFIKELCKKARSIDNTRLISKAFNSYYTKQDNPFVKIFDDSTATLMDAIGINEYVGWYDGLPDKCLKTKWEIKFNKPVIISEFGGGCLQGFHGDTLTIWTEEFQEDLYKKNLFMISQIPQLRGIAPWILADFRSPTRLLPDIQDQWNRKGVISEKGTRKKAFYTLKKFYENFSPKIKGESL